MTALVLLCRQKAEGVGQHGLIELLYRKLVTRVLQGGQNLA